MGWGDIFGNAARIGQLKKILAEEKFPHATIFSGVAGVGKRKIAETCAASLLCENPVGGEACGVCKNCRLFNAGSHPDFSVVEPEESKAAPIIKIAQVRALQAEAALKPMFARRRVIIIDGAELMNNPTANSLLKTLEEPTGETIFILTTANRAGLLMTMRSRCVTINFDKIPAAEIKAALIARGVERARAEIISRVADGSFGRALKLESSGGYELRESALRLVEKISAGNLVTEEIFIKGAEIEKWPREKFGEFVVYVQKILRDAYVLGAVEPLNVDLKPRLEKIKIPAESLCAMFDAGTEILRRLRSNAALRLLAESYFMRLNFCLNRRA